MNPGFSIPEFIRYAEGKLPALKAAVKRQLDQPEVIEGLANLACTSSWDALTAFLRDSPNAAAVASRIDQTAWETAQLSRESGRPESIFALAQALNRLGRPELAEAPGRVLIRKPEPRHWDAPGIGLPQVGNALRLGQPEGTEAMRRFLSSVVTRPWLERQYNTANSGTIAGTLYSLWIYLDEPVLNHFRIVALEERVRRELADLQAKDAEQLSQAIQLLGCATLVRIPIDLRVDWPGDLEIEAALQRPTPPGSLSDIGHVQVQQWLGLREAARLCGEGRLRVNALVGDQILALWKKAEGRTERHRALNALMIPWLEACARAGWCLVADPVPLRALFTAPSSRPK